MAENRIHPEEPTIKLECVQAQGCTSVNLHALWAGHMQCISECEKINLPQLCFCLHLLWVFRKLWVNF